MAALAVPDFRIHLVSATVAQCLLRTAQAWVAERTRGAGWDKPPVAHRNHFQMRSI